MDPFEILPSPGTEDKTFEEIEKKLIAVKGVAKSIHIDIIDGKFTDNTTFSDPTPFAKYAKDFILEVHLMVEEPVMYLKKFAESGFKRFIGQIEKMSDQRAFVADAQVLGEVGLAIDKQTSITDITVPFDNLDSILVMTIQAGFSGQTFEDELLVKVKDLRDQTDIAIEVDGGINEETIKIAKNVGANRFVATSFVFGSDKSPKEQFNILDGALH